MLYIGIITGSSVLSGDEEKTEMNYGWYYFVVGLDDGNGSDDR